MTSEEIVKALREDCKTCSESLICENGTNLAGLYCANKDAADLIERLTADVADLRKELEWKDMVIALAQRKQAEAEEERDALREKQRWIPVTERMPEEQVLVNVVWVNRAPESYYEKIKGVPFSGTACFYRERWYWDSPVVLDLLAEYGKDDFDLVDDAVEITHWMPLPEAPEGGEKDADCQRRD